MPRGALKLSELLTRVAKSGIQDRSRDVEVDLRHRMQTGGGKENEKVGQNSELSVAQALLWWTGVGKAGLSSPLKSLPVDQSDATTAAVVQLGFEPSQQSTTPLLVPSAEEGHVPDSSAVRTQRVPVSGYEDGTGDEQCQQSASLSLISQFPTEYILPRTQLELGHCMARAAYPYADPYFGGMVAGYGAQAMIHPQILGVQQARMPLPSEMTEEEPVYVNAKQYHGILRRRQSRAKAESENKLIRARKPYLHESRHLHAMKRARGCGGRFLNTKNKDKSESKSDGNVSSEGQSSQEGMSCESREIQMESSSTGSLKQNTQTIQGISTQLMASMGQSCVNGSAYHPGMLNSGGHSVISSSTGQAGYSNYSNQRFHSSVFHPCPG